MKFIIVISNIIINITLLLQGQNSQLSFGRGGGPIYLIRVSCTGSELKLLDCAYTNPPHNTYRNDVQIQCNPGT